MDEFKNGWCHGNSLEMKRVRFKGEKKLIGTIQNVKIFKAQEWILYAARNKKTT